MINVGFCPDPLWQVPTEITANICTVLYLAKKIRLALGRGR